jgi:hypothetical protein
MSFTKYIFFPFTSLFTFTLTKQLKNLLNYFSLTFYPLSFLQHFFLLLSFLSFFLPSKQSLNYKENILFYQQSLGDFYKVNQDLNSLTKIVTNCSTPTYQFGKPILYLQLPITRCAH